MPASAGLRQFLRRVYSLVQNIAARGEVKRVNDAPRMQELQVSLLAKELRDGLEHPQPYGLTSHPRPGAEVFALFFGGSRDHGIAIVVDDRRYRLRSLAEGEVALYDDLGQVVHLKRGGIEVTSPTKVTVTAPELELDGEAIVTGNLRVDGNVEAAGNVDDLADTVGQSMAQMRATYNAHTHIENDAAPAPTQTPLPQML